MSKWRRSVPTPLSRGDAPYPYGGKPIPPSIGDDLYFITFPLERGMGTERLHGRGVWGKRKSKIFYQ